MKRLIALLCAVLLLSGCVARIPQSDPIVSKPTDAPTAPATEAPTDSPTEPAAPTDPAETVPAETDPADPDSYTLRLSAAVPIFEGPSYDECYLRVVGEDGVYTIVEEVTDEEGNLWGRLKSGVGWIDLTALEAAADDPITIAYADDALLKSGEFVEYAGDSSEYAAALAFRANEKLTNVTFSMLEPDMVNFEGYTIHEVLYTADTLEPGRPLVARVLFYGDLTAYGITFTDADGEEYALAVYISGRNSALVVEEFTP